MQINLDSQGLGTAATAKSKECVERYAQDLLDMASTFEANQRWDIDDPPEITLTMVADADNRLRRAHASERSNRSKWYQLGATAATIIATVAASNLDKDWGPFLFIITVSVAIGATAMSILDER